MSTRSEQVKALTAQLEQGVKDVFHSDNYLNFLRTMAKFHSYSVNNDLLIHLQCPNASFVAGYTTWRDKFHRHVKAGEQGIRILAPAPYKCHEEVEDPITHEQVLRPIVVMSYRTAVCFDYSQTEGEPLPELIHELTGDVSQYEDLLEAIRRISPVPIDFMAVPGQAYGYFSPSESKIAIQSGLSQVQTVKTALHELTHSLLHNKDVLKENQKDRRTIEIEAESTAFVVSSSLGLSVEEYSFPYVASWSSSQSVKELKSSLKTIRQTSSHIIDQLQAEMRSIQMERSQEQIIVHQELPEHIQHQAHISL